MSKNKEFILQPGIWLGQGKISFAHSPENLNYYTKWKIEEQKDGIIKAIQIVELEENKDQRIHSFTFQLMTSTTFQVILEIEGINKVEGAGLYHADFVCWNFQNQQDFQGIEIYQRQTHESFTLRSEYGSTEAFKTTIDGLIWFKSEI